jgi:phosphoribosyl 1,2-cyclic phosphate phosphodiesterase
MPVLGFKLGNFIYITDANVIDTEVLEKLYDTDILVLNALRKEPHISHFTLSQAIAIVAQTNAKQAYFTHISHQLGLHHAINASLPANIALAYDGLTLQIP